MVVSRNFLRVVRAGALVTSIVSLVILSVGCWATVVSSLAAVVGFASVLSMIGLSVVSVASFMFSVGLIVLRSFSEFFSVPCGNDVTSVVVVALVVVAVVGFTLDFTAFLRVIVVAVVFSISVGNTVFTLFDNSLDLFEVVAALPLAKTADL